MPNSNLHALILAAGQGTRMKSAKAKVLHEVLGRPLLDYPIRMTEELGVQSCIVVTGHQSEAVREAFADRASVKFALQAEQKGTGHAVLCGKDALPSSGSVLILIGDSPLLRREVFEDFVDAHGKSGNAITVLAAHYPDPTGYGRVIVNGETGIVERIVEQKDAGPLELSVNLCNTGIYLCDIESLYRLLGQVEPDNAQAEYYLTDIVSLAGKEGLSVGVYHAASHEDFLGVNDRRQLAEAASVLQKRIVEGHQRSGVTINQAEGVYIEASVVIGADCIIESPAHLAGATKLGEGVVVEMGSRFENANVAAGSHIKAHSILEDCDVGENCIIGPLAHLRAGTVLDANVHIGNYVETKKTRLGKGSKANHLTYLGDADVGSGVNVGAGTITCNYDGVNKHKTVIEDDVFIGSDTQLIAPVTVRKGAVIGAGTTVTKDVPPDALAVSRLPQKNVEGYRQRKPMKKPTNPKS